MLFKLFAAAPCDPVSFFLIPPWYRYLRIEQVGGVCRPVVTFINPTSGNLDLSVVLLLGLGILDILLRLAALVAVGYIIYAGAQFIFASGEPDKAKKAIGTVINALIGLGITIVAAATVSFIGHRVSG